ncbi:SapB/AmfS family lanthipeptide [Streptomyces yaizuensis]|uniref:SapB/AmfS family lanthipeptide n=1 Tax=Streptomyces yaizuensis TaxID=2989713 RepID=A0ABQ5P5T0_9ACTN|nr:SapB/AmfS family lanthipeptide [Streptomyces sp. YSPA8]GLF97912.1 SapB/AmfS family lanthipeptide [Streptomyces sp. YSPA8]
MALLDLQALETPADESFGDVEAGSTVSLILCNPHSNVSLTVC